MNFFRSVKPRSFVEWAMIVLVVLLLALTSVLVISRQLLPDRNEVRLQALTESNEPSLTSTQPVATTGVTTLAATEKATETEPVFAAFPKMEQLTRRLSREAFDRQLKLFRDFSEKQRETESTGGQTQLYNNIPAAPAAQEESTPAQNTSQWYGPTSESTLSEYQQGILEQYGATVPDGLKYWETDPTAAETAPPGFGPESSYNAPPTSYAPPADNAETAAPAPAAPPSTESISAAQSGALALLNDARAKAGMGALAWDAGLQSLATVRAAELSVLYSHSRPDGSYILAYCPGENICWHDNMANISGSSVFTQFFTSPSHYEIMMDPSYTCCAIGIYALPGPAGVDGTGNSVPASGRYYVSMVFR